MVGSYFWTWWYDMGRGNIHVKYGVYWRLS